jgi:hypothetical protein
LILDSFDGNNLYEKHDLFIREIKQPEYPWMDCPGLQAQQLLADHIAQERSKCYPSTLERHE